MSCLLVWLKLLNIGFLILVLFMETAHMYVILLLPSITTTENDTLGLFLYLALRERNRKTAKEEIWFLGELYWVSCSVMSLLQGLN